MVNETSLNAPVEHNNEAGANSISSSADPKLKSLPDTNRLVFYGRLLESIFANPTYRQVLYEIATKELHNAVTAKRAKDQPT